MFATEAELVEVFATTLASDQSCFAELKTLQEFPHSEGRADVIGIRSDGDVFAFEAKLHRWKDCLHQAYRNSFYAHYSYVILPVSTATEAARRQHEFERRGVGLCTVETGEIKIWITAQRKEPIKMWLTRAAAEAAAPGVSDDKCKVSSRG